jgi:hypothetical protein
MLFLQLPFSFSLLKLQYLWQSHRFGGGILYKGVDRSLINMLLLIVYQSLIVAFEPKENYVRNSFRISSTLGLKGLKSYIELIGMLNKGLLYGLAFLNVINYISRFNCCFSGKCKGW